MPSSVPCERLRAYHQGPHGWYVSSEMVHSTNETLPGHPQTFTRIVPRTLCMQQSEGHRYSSPYVRVHLSTGSFRERACYRSNVFIRGKRLTLFSMILQAQSTSYLAGYLLMPTGSRSAAGYILRPSICPLPRIKSGLLCLYLGIIVLPRASRRITGPAEMLVERASCDRLALFQHRQYPSATFEVLFRPRSHSDSSTIVEL